MAGSTKRGTTKIANIRGLDETIDGAPTLDGVLFTGIAYERDARTGALIGLMGFRDGRIHGPSRTWDSTGHMREEEYYYLGGLHGPYRHWDEAGRLIHESYREHSISHWERTWDSSTGLSTTYKISFDPKSQAELERTRRSWGYPVPVIDIDLQSWQFVERPAGWLPDDMCPPS